MPKLKHETQETTQFDKETQTTVTTSKTFALKAKNSEEFYFTFFSYLQKGLKIKNIVDVHVLTKFCMIMEYDSTKVMLPTQRRKDVCVELGIKSPHLSNSINRLKELGIMTGDSGVYEVNPYLVWKGKTDTRDKLLKEEGLEIKLRFGGKEVNDMPADYNPFLGGNSNFDNETGNI